MGKGSRLRDESVVGSVGASASPTSIAWVLSMAFTTRTRAVMRLGGVLSSGSATMRSGMASPPVRTTVMTGAERELSPTAIEEAVDVAFAVHEEPAGMASTSMFPAATANGTVAVA